MKWRKEEYSAPLPPQNLLAEGDFPVFPPWPWNLSGVARGFLRTVVFFCNLNLTFMVFLLVLGNRSQSNLPVHFFLLYCKLSEASNGHFGFLHYLDWELGTKTFIWVHLQSVALPLTRATIVSETLPVLEPNKSYLLNFNDLWFAVINHNELLQPVHWVLCRLQAT